MTTPDLSPEERDALHRVWNEWTVTRQPGGPINVVKFVLALLEAAPSLREIPGMELDKPWWGTRLPSGEVGFLYDASRDSTIRYAASLNRHGPGHHAVRLAVVEVANG